jgi:hypothetical protein
MRKARRIRGKNAGQEGYVLVLVVFLLALLVVALAAATPNILVNGRRDKEEEMIWRGKQYVRGIRLFVRYYQMHGGQTKFPTSMEDLTKNKVGIRFMRQEYKDPMNHADGSWRFIYVGPNGQLIGSLKPRPLGGTTPGTGGTSAGGFGSLFGGGQTGAPGTQGSSFGNSSFGNSSFGGASPGNSSFGNSSFNNNAQSPQANANPAQPGAADPQEGTDAQDGTTTQNGNNWGDMSTPQAIANADVNVTIVGGNIIGVGSKVNEKSIIWYDKAKNYRQFEFIWDPSKEPVNGGANAGVVGIPGQVPLNGASSPFGSPAGGNSGFGQPSGFGSGSPGTNPGAGQGQNGAPEQPPPGTQSPMPQ